MESSFRLTIQLFKNRRIQYWSTHVNCIPKEAAQHQMGSKLNGLTTKTFLISFMVLDPAFSKIFWVYSTTVSERKCLHLLKSFIFQVLHKIFFMAFYEWKVYIKFKAVHRNSLIKKLERNFQIIKLLQTKR